MNPLRAKYLLAVHDQKEGGREVPDISRLKDRVGREGGVRTKTLDLPSSL